VPQNPKTPKPQNPKTPEMEEVYLYLDDNKRE